MVVNFDTSDPPDPVEVELSDEADIQPLAIKDIEIQDISFEVSTTTFVSNRAIVGPDLDQMFEIASNNLLTTKANEIAGFIDLPIDPGWCGLGEI